VRLPLREVQVLPLSTASALNEPSPHAARVLTSPDPVAA
jgi:hypothetical protein